MKGARSGEEEENTYSDKKDKRKTKQNRTELTLAYTKGKQRMGKERKKTINEWIGKYELKNEGTCVCVGGA